jgi:hypothetical protein
VASCVLCVVSPVQTPKLLRKAVVTNEAARGSTSPLGNAGKSRNLRNFFSGAQVFFGHDTLCDASARSHQTTLIMSAAYKSAMRSGGDFDGDDASSDASDAEGNSAQGESSDEETTSAPAKRKDISQLPVEIRNRILMLTSRGVSYR